MNRRIRIKNVLAYLFQKGWTLKHSGKRFHVLEAPVHFQFQPDPYFSIPLEKYEDISSDYDYFMDRFANSIAEFYQLDKNDLLKIWSQTPEQLKAEIKEKQEFLNYVS